MFDLKKNLRMSMYLLLLSLFSSTVFAQKNDDPAGNQSNQKLRVYISGFPDLSFLREKIKFILLVNTKDPAQVIVNLEKSINKTN